MFEVEGRRKREMFESTAFPYINMFTSLHFQEELSIYLSLNHMLRTNIIVMMLCNLKNFKQAIITALKHLELVNLCIKNFYQHNILSFYFVFLDDKRPVYTLDFYFSLLCFPMSP